MTPNQKRRRGYVLLVAAMCAMAICGALGLAVDVGRLYVTRNEMQTFTDSASLAAAAELDGTASGYNRARQAVASNPNHWNLGTSDFTGTQVDFSAAANGPWTASPGAASGYVYARVTAGTTSVLYFLPAVTVDHSLAMTVTTVAGQVPKTAFAEGLTPFSPFAHSPTPDMGFTPGQQYALRWPPNPKLNNNVCSGDNAQQWIDQAQAAGGSERGYFEDTSAAAIRQAIIGNYQTQPIVVGQNLKMTGGNKQTEANALITRIGQDSNTTAASYTEYAGSGTGNGRRLVVVPVNGGAPNFTVVGFALFYLLSPAAYGGPGNQPWCAEYVGPYVQGSRYQAGGAAGAYAVRLVQ
jgi:Flp pilus assembly protein TadG